MKTIESRVISVVTEQVAGVSTKSITADTTFFDDLQFDSLDGLEVLMAIENEFEIDIDDEELESIKTVADVIALVTRVLGEN